MRPKLFLLSAFLMLGSVSAQVFNTAHVLPPGKVSLGINPIMLNNSGVNDFVLFLHGGYGLKPGLDLGARLGVGYEGSNNYWGLDLEWVLNSARPLFSVTTGIHALEDIGLDLTGNLTFPMNRTAHVYCGIDSDINFSDPVRMPVWLFAGADVIVERNMALLFELNFGVTEPATN
ncbi:MAG TPA: hypothetical protein PKV71_21605, partial [Calditrichia bacterium]|nr:hypothetical protein [Calditrichia bacterium]